MSLEKIYSTRAEICRDSFDSLTLLIDCFRATIVIRELIDWFHFTSIDLHRRDKNEKQDDAFKEVITSCQSLSSFETTSLKTAVPQVSH